MLSKAVVKSRPNVLWCYKKELYLSSHKKKRVKQIKKMVARGLMDPENEDPFSLFVASTDIKYTYYADTQKILGNTYGMAVLQDFEALTPNLLARTVETVEGGGIIVLEELEHAKARHCPRIHTQTLLALPHFGSAPSQRRVAPRYTASWSGTRPTRTGTTWWRRRGSAARTACGWR